jgi:hypothetical protein
LHLWQVCLRHDWSRHIHVRAADSTGCTAAVPLVCGALPAATEPQHGRLWQRERIAAACCRGCATMRVCVQSDDIFSSHRDSHYPTPQACHGIHHCTGHVCLQLRRSYFQAVASKVNAWRHRTLSGRNFHLPLIGPLSRSAVLFKGDGAPGVGIDQPTPSVPSSINICVCIEDVKLQLLGKSVFVPGAFKALPRLGHACLTM